MIADIRRAAWPLRAAQVGRVLLPGAGEHLQRHDKGRVTSASRVLQIMRRFSKSDRVPRSSSALSQTA